MNGFDYDMASKKTTSTSTDIIRKYCLQEKIQTMSESKLIVASCNSKGLEFYHVLPVKYSIGTHFNHFRNS